MLRASRTETGAPRPRDEAGFSILELLIVTVVIGIIVAMAMASLLNALDKAKQRATMADMRTISRALEAYLVDNHVVPDSSGGVAVLGTVLIPYQINVVPQTDHCGNT